jgi:hypothetical protein
MAQTEFWGVYIFSHTYTIAQQRHKQIPESENKSNSDPDSMLLARKMAWNINFSLVTIIHNISHATHELTNLETSDLLIYFLLELFPLVLF